MEAIGKTLVFLDEEGNEIKRGKIVKVRHLENVAGARVDLDDGSDNNIISFNVLKKLETMDTVEIPVTQQGMIRLF